MNFTVLLFYCISYYLLKLQINFSIAGCPWWDEFSSFSLTFHLGILENSIFLFFFLLSSYVLVSLLVLWQNIRSLENVIMNLTCSGMQFWSHASFGLPWAGRDWRPRSKNSHLWKTPEGNCSCQESPRHIL